MLEGTLDKELKKKWDWDRDMSPGGGDVDKKPVREWRDLVDDDNEAQLKGEGKRGERVGQGRCWDNWETKAEWSGRHGWSGDGQPRREAVKLVAGGVGACCV